MAKRFGTSRQKKDEWERSEASWTLLLPQALHDEHLLPEQGMPQGLLETSKVKTLASAGHDHHQAWFPKQHLQHKVLSKCWLRHRSLLDCHKGETETKEVSSLKEKGQPRINISKTAYPEKNQEFNEQLEETLNTAHRNAERNAEDSWNPLRNAIYSTAVLTYGKKERKNTDWFEASITEMEPVIDGKRSALISYKRDPSQRNLQALRAARSKAQQTAQRCANDYWLQLSDNIQQASDSGNIRGMYEGIKQATGKPTKKTAPLKSKTGEVITDRDKQMGRWVEHYLELYARENSVTQEKLDAIEELPVLEELDSEPTMEELSKAIDALACGRAPGEDSIPPKIIKCGKPALLEPLHELLCLCWREGKVPQDMRDAKIITVYKNKGDRSDCYKYRGISLLSIVGKVFARVVLARLQVLTERIYPESQCGFRAERSTVDMIFSVRQLQENCREQQMPLYIVFIDLMKALTLSAGRAFSSC